MHEVLEGVLGGEILTSSESWKRSVALLAQKAELVQLPREDDEKDSMSFVSTMVQLGELQGRLQRNAENIGIDYSQCEAWVKSDVVITSLFTVAKILCEKYGKVDFDIQLICRYEAAGLLTVPEAVLKE